MFSKYIDNLTDDKGSFISMDGILHNILNYKSWRTDIIDPFTNEPLLYQVSKVYDENQKIKIKGTEFIFNYIKYEYDTVIAGQESNPISAERLKKTFGRIVIYTDGVRTQYLVDKARGPAALRILRVINNSDKNKIIEAQSFNITEDFFIWLLSRFMNGSTILDEEDSLKINRITGFKGEGSQKQAILSGSGNEIMNMLSSLSFLVEMDVMTEVEARIIRGSETLELRFYSKNSQLDILVESYTGEYMILHDEEMTPRILLNSFIEIIPSIMNAYNEDIENDAWTKNSKREFTLGLVDSVREKLNILYPPQNT